MMTTDKIPTPTTNPLADLADLDSINPEAYVGEVKPIVKAMNAMTQQDCENWIVLKGQSGERWFEVRILDKDVGQDPTMIALMETVSEMIFSGIKDMPFLESETLRAQDAANQLKKDNPLIIVP